VAPRSPWVDPACSFAVRRSQSLLRPSDGQFVLVNEALNLDIAIYNLRQGEGIRYETLFRDETVGGLDAANAKEYVRMLRRAMDLGGFHQVVFICHSPLVWELANRVLQVHGGQVSPDGETAPHLFGPQVTMRV